MKRQKVTTTNRTKVSNICNCNQPFTLTYLSVELNVERGQIGTPGVVVGFEMIQRRFGDWEHGGNLIGCPAQRLLAEPSAIALAYALCASFRKSEVVLQCDVAPLLCVCLLRA